MKREGESCSQQCQSNGLILLLKLEKKKRLGQGKPIICSKIVKIIMLSHLNFNDLRAKD